MHRNFKRADIIFGNHSFGRTARRAAFAVDAFDLRRTFFRYGAQSRVVKVTAVVVFNVFNHVFDFFGTDKRTLRAFHVGHRACFIEKIARSEQFFRARLAEYRGRIHRVGHFKRHPRSKVGFYRTFYNLYVGALSSKNKIHSRRPRFLCDARDFFFYIFLFNAHQIRKLVDYYDYPRHFSLSARIDLIVVLVYIPYYRIFEFGVPVLHFLYRPVKHSHRFGRVAKYFVKVHMRYTCENRKFDLFGVDDYKTQFLRTILVHKADEERVKSHALTRTRRTRNKQVRHLSYIRNYGITYDVLTYRER